jgi:alpha-L-arabinofuranosidase
MGDAVIDQWITGMPTLAVVHEDTEHFVPALDTAATLDSDSGAIAVSLVNRDPARRIAVTIDVNGAVKDGTSPVFRFLAAPDKESHNDIDCPEAVHIDDGEVLLGKNGTVKVEMPPHSVGVVRIG